MSYSDYKTVRQVVEKFGLTIDPVDDLFLGVEPITPGPILAGMLATRAPRALAIGNEVGRREAIIGPFLYEAEARASRSVTVFAGVALDFNADLSGFPDYLFGEGKPTSWVQAPICAVVEAKEEKFGEGSGQCAAAMVGAREFNAKKGTDRPVFGCVTSGTDWFFFRLTGTTLSHEMAPRLYLPAGPLLGVLVAIANTAS